MILPQWTTYASLTYMPTFSAFDRIISNNILYSLLFGNKVVLYAKWTERDIFDKVGGFTAEPDMANRSNKIDDPRSGVNFDRCQEP